MAKNIIEGLFPEEGKEPVDLSQVPEGDLIVAGTMGSWPHEEEYIRRRLIEKLDSDKQD